MSVVKYRNAAGEWVNISNVQGPPGRQGKDYVITEADYEKIAEKLEPEINELRETGDERWAMAEGVVWDYQTRIETAYAATAPAGAKTAAIHEIGGRSVVWNQKVPYTIASKTTNGVTVTNTGTSYVLNGTATATVYFNVGSPTTSVVGHKYCVKGCPAGGGNGNYNLYNDGGLMDIGSGVVAAATAAKTLYIHVLNGVTVENLEFRPQMFDLTEMFGAGNEPTLEEFNAMFPEEFYPYAAPAIVSPDVASVVHGDTVHAVPAAIRSLPGYGWGISETVRNYIDLDRQKYVQMVGRIVIDGTQQILTNTKGGINRWIVTVPDMKSGASTDIEINLMSKSIECRLPNTSTPTSEFAFRYTNNRLFFNLSSSKGDTADEIGQWLKNNPMEFYYELAEPIETDIDWMPDEFVVAAGDSIEFMQADGTFPALSKIEYLVALGEVAK